MNYRNKSAKPVMLSYTLVVMRDTSARRSNNGGAEPVKSQWISGVFLPAGESKAEVIAITVPADMLVANAVVQGMSYEQR